MAQCYIKPHPVNAWQYNGNIDLSALPEWVISNLGHGVFYSTMSGLQHFDGLKWTDVSEGDWLVQYDEYPIVVVSDKKFKKFFEVK